MKRIILISILSAILLIMVITFACTCSSVPAGHTGILTTFGKVEDKVLSAGLNWKSPFQHVIMMDNRTQKREEHFQAFSSDIQEVDVLLAVNYSINQETAQNLYRTVGTEYYTNIVYPRLLEGTKAVFSNYTAERLISNRENLSVEIMDFVRAEIEKYGIIISAISVQDIDFTDAFTNAVEAKQVAAQNKLAAETEQAQKLMETEAAAEMRRIEATAEADALKTKAEADAYAIKLKAEAEAEANMQINKSLTKTLIDYIYANRWDGQYPIYFGGDNALIDLRPY